MEIEYSVEKMKLDYYYTDDDGRSSVTITASRICADDDLEDDLDDDANVEFCALPPETVELVRLGDRITVIIPHIPASIVSHPKVGETSGG